MVIFGIRLFAIQCYAYRSAFSGKPWNLFLESLGIIVPATRIVSKKIGTYAGDECIMIEIFIDKPLWPHTKGVQGLSNKFIDCYLTR